MVLRKKVENGDDDGVQNQHDGIEVSPRGENRWAFVGYFFFYLLHE